ncbi:MAG: uroporphyrinogen decarboxylase family protein [Sedimentisphaerales bacterium]|nr:uroporphyrinogen decarboxylase family protein [Sedimentisphaerales bacterium]
MEKPKKELMSKRERVEATLNFQETDRVPVYDLFLNDAVIEYFTGKIAPPGKEGNKLRAQAIGHILDMTRGATFPPQEPGDHKDEFGIVKRWEKWRDCGFVNKPFSDESGAKNYLVAVINKLKLDIKNLSLKQYTVNFREEFIETQNFIGDDTVQLLRESGTGLDWIRAALGLELFSYISADGPELISEYLELYTEREVMMIHAIADRELSPCTLTYGDIACKGKLLHSPRFLRQEFFPRLKRINGAFHEHDIKCLFHSDGYVMEIIPDLIEAGCDGLNPIETVARMDIAEVKRLYGDKLFLAGGIDISQLMASGTPDDVRKVCRAAIKIAYPGYFIGSTTELDNGSTMENIFAMVETAWQFKPPKILPQTA